MNKIADVLAADTARGAAICVVIDLLDLTIKVLTTRTLVSVAILYINDVRRFLDITSSHSLGRIDLNYI